MMVFSQRSLAFASSKHHRGTTMNYYAGIDVSLEDSCICVIDANGKVVQQVEFEIVSNRGKSSAENLKVK
jgi:hypothetical protein